MLCTVYYYTHIHELSKIPYNLPHALHTKIQDSRLIICWDSEWVYRYNWKTIHYCWQSVSTQHKHRTEVRDKGKLQGYGTSDRQHLYHCATTLEITTCNTLDSIGQVPFRIQTNSIAQSTRRPQTWPRVKPLALVCLALVWLSPLSRWPHVLCIRTRFRTCHIRRHIAFTSVECILKLPALGTSGEQCIICKESIALNIDYAWFWRVGRWDSWSRAW